LAFLAIVSLRDAESKQKGRRRGKRRPSWGGGGQLKLEAQAELHTAGQVRAAGMQEA